MERLNGTIPHERVRELIEAHMQLQVGCYFSNVTPLHTGFLATSDRISDHYWNSFACFSPDRLQELLPEIEAEFRRRDRLPTVYVDPAADPDRTLPLLRNQGYASENEVWMLFEGSDLASPKSDLTSVYEVSSGDSEAVGTFLRVFSVAFGGPATTADGYGDLPPEYLAALRDSLEASLPRKAEHHHFLATHADEPVGCASIHIADRFAGLYNVGVAPGLRNRGIGAVLSAHCFRFASLSRANSTFLQTQPGGSVQKFYEKLGCRVAFYTSMCYQSRDPR